MLCSNFETICREGNLWRNFTVGCHYLTPLGSPWCEINQRRLSYQGFLPDSYRYSAKAASTNFFLKLELCSINFVRPLKTAKLVKWNISTTSGRKIVNAIKCLTGKLLSRLLSPKGTVNGKTVYELLKEKQTTTSHQTSITDLMKTRLSHSRTTPQSSKSWAHRQLKRQAWKHIAKT